MMGETVEGSAGFFHRRAVQPRQRRTTVWRTCRTRQEASTSRTYCRAQAPGGLERYVSRQVPSALTRMTRHGTSGSILLQGRPVIEVELASRSQH